MAGAKRLAQLILGASHVTQAVIPSLLTPSTPEERETLHKWKSNLYHALAEQAQFLCQELALCPGLQVVEPQGAMYAMIRINGAKEAPASSLSTTKAATPTDVQFCKLLLEEENVLVLPGKAFGASEPNLVRVVFCAPEPIMFEAMSRMKRFCQRHFGSQPPGGGDIANLV